MAGYICPGSGASWMLNGTSQYAGSDITGTDSALHAKLPGVISWELSTELEEATTIRTSDTGGVKVKPCADTLEFDLNISVALDTEDWIYAYILNDPGASKPLNAGDPRTCWLFLTWDDQYKVNLDATFLEVDAQGQHMWMDQNNAAPSGVPAYDGSDNGVWVFGTFSAPGIGIDNDGTDVAQSDLTFSISENPLFPRTQGAALAFPSNGHNLANFSPATN